MKNSEFYVADMAQKKSYCLVNRRSLVRFRLSAFKFYMLEIK